MNNVVRTLFLGLSGKMRTVFGICFLITMIILGVFIYSNLQTYQEKLTRIKLENATRLIYTITDIHTNSSLKNYLAALAGQTRELAEAYQAKVLAGEWTSAEALAQFRSLLTTSAFGRPGGPTGGGSIAALDLDGRVLIHPDTRLEGQDLSGLEVVREALRQRNGFLHYLWKEETPAAGDLVIREKMAALAYYAPWKMIMWVSVNTSAAIGLANEAELNEQLTHLKIGQHGYAFIMDTKGNLILHPENSLIGKNIRMNTDSLNIRFFDKILLALEEEKRAVAETGTETGVQSEAENEADLVHGALVSTGNLPAPVVKSDFYVGEDPSLHNPLHRLGAYVYYPKREWIIFTSTPSGEMYTEMNSIKSTIFAIVALAFILSNLAVALIIYMILKPVKEMKRVVLKMAHGDLSNRLEIISNDEIGEVAEHFNSLLDKFEEVLQGIRNSSASLLDSVQGLSVSSQEISSTSNEQAAAVKEIVSTMEDSDTLAKSIADKINDVAHIAIKMKETVDNGFSIIKSSLTKMDEIKSSNSATIVGVQSLSDKIRSIWEIVNIINGIADQTKIIAFNAELEASAAGEAGKNFQIVATEIRRLADNTVSSTNEIRSKINEIQHSSDTLIISSEDGTLKIKEGWNMSNELQHVFEDILQSSEISANSAEQIALSINQQVSAFEQILLTLRQISEGIDNFVDSTKTTTAESDKLKDMADSLNSTINQYITDDGEVEL